jgi:hypothetical protein
LPHSKNTIPYKNPTFNPIEHTSSMSFEKLLCS